MNYEEINFIRKYVSEKYFDVDKLVEHLKSRQMILINVFRECKYVHIHESFTPRILLSTYGYETLEREVFIRRCPFFFYTGTDILTLLIEDAIAKGHDIESVYQTLEELFYEYFFSVEEIYTYICKQNLAKLSDTLFMWKDYLSMRLWNPESGIMPERLLTAYYDIIEKSGIKPPDCKATQKEVCNVDGYIEFAGTFPCDTDGQPILKWINLQIDNPRYIKCTCKYSEVGTMQVGLNHNTVIWETYEEVDGSIAKRLIYCGSKHITFNFGVLRNKRKQLELSQEYVSDAIDTSVRTYQRWENGEAEPSGVLLLRLLNFLQLSVDEVITADVK